MRTRPRRRSLEIDGSGSGSFYGYLGDLCNALDPHSVLLKCWHQLLLGCLLFEAFLLPFAVTFASEVSSTTAFQVFYVAEVLFCADFYVKLNTGFYEAGNIHRDKRRARVKYLKSVGFVLDVLAIVPLSVILHFSDKDSMPTAATFQEEFRPGWLEFHKVLRIWRVPGYLSNLDDVYSKRFRALKLSKLLVATALVAHFVACGRFAFGFNSDTKVPDMWLPPASMKSKPLRTQYVLALFWGVGLLTGTFEGALPRCNAEFAFTLTVTLLGFVLFVYACATLFMLSKSERNQTKLARARINQLRHLLTFHHVPESLQLQAVEYLKRHYTEADSNDRDVVKMLCPSITKDIQVELLKDVIGRIPLFRGCSQPFIVALTSLLEIKSFPAHVTLFETGAKGDYMYVVNSGVLHILVNGVKVRELRQGSFFGEVSVFSKRPRSAAVITTSYCTLYRLSRFHIERVLEGYPEYASQISATIDDMVDEHGARASETPHGGSEEFMLTTLFQLTTKLPAKRKKSSLRDKAKIVTTASMRRSKSTKVLSASRHSEYDGGNISMSENRAINFSPIPIQLPSTVIIKKPSGKLVRSQSAYARRVSSGVAWWPQRAGSTKSLNSSRVDTMQGFYDNLSRRQGSQPSAGGAMSNIIGKLLMRRVIDHTSHWRRTWLILLQIHLAVNWYIVPMLLAFPILDCPDANRSLHVVYTVLDVLLVIDMYLNFHLTFTASRKKVTQPSQLAKHYLRRSFIADLLCVLPYQLLAPASNASVLIAHPALFRVPRLFRAWRIKGHKKEWESSFHLGSTSWIIVLGICYTLLLHILACVYFSLTYLEGFGSGANSWLPPSDLDLRRTFDGRMEYIGGQSNISYSQVEAHTVAGMQYALSLYFGVTMLTTLGKTVEPSSTLQYSVALVFMVSGFILLSIMIDSVQESVTTSAFEQKEFLVTRTRVQNFIRSRTVPSGVQQRVKSFLEFWWSSHRGAIVSDLLNELPDSIKRPVLRSMCQPALRTLTLLADVRSSLDALELVFVDNARFILYGQGEIIYRQGDYANGLFFLLEGELIIIANGGMPRTIVKGGFIGTAALNLNETSVSYEERVTAASGCILIYVSRDHLNGMHRVFPTFSMALRALEKRLEGAKLARAQQDYSGRERSSSGSLRSIPDMKKLTFEMKVLKYVGFDDVVFDPDDSTSELWKLCTFGFTIALYFKVIDDLASGVKSSSVIGSELLALLFEILFALDFYFHSRLGYYDFGNKIMDVSIIRKGFFRSYQCYCGILALTPLYAVNWVIGSRNRYEILNINKLLRLLRAIQTFSELENKHLHRTLQLRLVKLVLVSIMLSHLFGSIWINFDYSPQDSEPNMWGAPVSLKGANKHVQYSASLFWSFGLMSNSYSGTIPETTAQCWFTIIVLLTGAFLLAFVVGSISDVVELIDASSREFNGKISSLRLLLAHFRLPSGIEGQLKTYFFFQRYHTITQEYLLERCLPPSLLTEIRLVHLQPMIAKVGFLAGMEGSVTRMLVSQLVQALTVKNQFVFHLGEEGSNMFFVFTGIIEVLVPLETLYRRQSHDTKLNSLGSPSRSSFHTFFPTLDPSKLQAKNQLKKVNELTSGSYFGEVALFTNKPRSAHARCKTSCVLYKLSRRSLELVFERYPDWKRKVLKIVNIQQEQQHLRNLYMEEQMDMAAKTSKSVLNHADILGDATHLGTTNRSTNSSAGSYSDRVSFRMKNGMRKPSTRPIRSMSSMRSAGSFFSSYKAQRSASAETAITLQTAGQMKNAPWVDMLLQCTEAQSSFHVQWLRVIAFGTVYMALVVPYRNAYDSLERLSPLPIATRAVELTCEVLFGWDIWVNWNLKDGLESLELYENKHRDTYHRQRLWIDVISAIPIDHFLSDFYQSPVLCLNRCLKLANFPHYMREITRRSVDYERSRLCTLWILFFILMHWCACIYFCIATNESSMHAADNNNNWDKWSPPQSLSTISWTDPSLDLLMLRFLRGIFFSSTAFIKKGKVFEPTSYAEYTFTLFADFVGLIAMAFMIGEMANLYVSYICNEVEFRKNHTAVDMYLDRWHITGKLRARSHAFLSSLWSSHRGVNYQTIFDEIPQVIRIEAIMHIAYLPLRVFINNVFRPFATTHPHDRDVEAITRAIAQRLRYEGYPRDECVLIEGSVSKEMYFVVKGHLMSTNSSEPLLEVSSQRSSLHYKKGDYFGDLGLLGYSVGVSTVKTISACDLLSLSSEDLLEVILSRSLFQTALSIAVGGYRELCKRKRWDVMSRKDNAKAAEEDWGVELFGILNTRKKQWLDEALQFNAGVDSDPMNEPWTVSCLKPGQEVGMATISSPHACVKMFEKLLRLIATRGLLDVNNLHQSAAQFQDTLPVMAADLSTHRSTISVTERSDSSKLSSNKLSYLH